MMHLQDARQLIQHRTFSEHRATLSPFVEQLQCRGDTMHTAVTKSRFETMPQCANLAFTSPDHRCLA